MRLFLLSDLHFGRANGDLVGPLLETISDADPDLVVIAGDFVQRARASHYEPAHDFLQRLDHPWLAVPGNHDIPLFNIPERILAPRAAYRRWIAEETEPLVETATAVVVGVDTTDRWHHQRGNMRPEQIERVADLIEKNAPDRVVVVVAHHPFHQDEGIEKKLMLNAPEALAAWGAAGPHVTLTGHLHKWKVEPFIAQKNRAMTLQVHCGTGLSTRLRGEPNDAALIDLAPARVRVSRLSVPEGGAGFETADVQDFTAGEDGWSRDEAAKPAVAIRR